MPDPTVLATIVGGVLTTAAAIGGRRREHLADSPWSAFVRGRSQLRLDQERNAAALEAYRYSPDGSLVLVRHADGGSFLLITAPNDGSADD